MHSPSIYMELHGPEELIGVHDDLRARGYTATTLDGIVVTDLVRPWHIPLWLHKDS